MGLGSIFFAVTVGVTSGLVAVGGIWLLFHKHTIKNIIRPEVEPVLNVNKLVGKWYEVGKTVYPRAFYEKSYDYFTTDFEVDSLTKKTLSIMNATWVPDKSEANKWNPVETFKGRVRIDNNSVSDVEGNSKFIVSPARLQTKFKYQLGWTDYNIVWYKESANQYDYIVVCSTDRSFARVLCRSWQVPEDDDAKAIIQQLSSLNVPLSKFSWTKQQQ